MIQNCLFIDVPKKERATIAMRATGAKLSTLDDPGRAYANMGASVLTYAD